MWIIRCDLHTRSGPATEGHPRQRVRSIPRWGHRLLHRLLLESGVSARCRQLVGVCHAIEILPVIYPDFADSTASEIANFAIGR
jgi:hypothetical protein